MTGTTDDASSFRPWRLAWQEALYGERGFYRADVGPRGHFETSANASGGVVELLAEALLTLAGRHDCTQIVDVGAGRGELLGALASVAPAMQLVGVDVVPRPDALTGRIGWWESPGGAELPDRLAGLRRTLVIAHEWLDVVPCDVLEVAPDGALRQVEVAPDGTERLGARATAEQLAWCTRWWPLDPADRPGGAAPGARVEVGLTRDSAWAGLLSRVHDGVALAVDYGHLAAGRPLTGTLAAHRHGHLVPPQPDASCDLTAHVAWDSLAASGRATVQLCVADDAQLHRCEDQRDGARLMTQRVALRELGVDAARPDLGADSAAYLRGLQRSGAAATLLDPGGLGGLGWLVQPVQPPPATGQADPAPARVEP